LILDLVIHAGNRPMPSASRLSSTATSPVPVSSNHCSSSSMPINRRPEETYCAVAIWKTASRNASSILFTDYTSPATMRANQLRPWLAAMAYGLLCALCRLALQQTQFAKATCGTIRPKLLKIAAPVRTSMRRITFAMASGCPYQRDFTLADAQLIQPAAR
jgi:hypothetical protein